MFVWKMNGRLRYLRLHLELFYAGKQQPTNLELTVVLQLVDLLHEQLFFMRIENLTERIDLYITGMHYSSFINQNHPNLFHLKLLYGSIATNEQLP